MTQKIESFLLAVLNKNGSEPCGTAFVVLKNKGLIVTSYHVVQAALSLSKTKDISHATSIRVRIALTGEKREALFLASRSSKKADIATLRISMLPRGISEAVLGSSEQSVGNAFASSGYRKATGGAVGTIAPLEPEPTSNPYRRIVLRSDQIDSGMSGAPILDLSHNRVIAMVTSTWYASGTNQKDTETAFAIPVEAICDLNPELRIEKPEIIDPKRGYTIATITGTLTGTLTYVGVSVISDFFHSKDDAKELKTIENDDDDDDDDHSDDDDHGDDDLVDTDGFDLDDYMDIL